MRLCAIISLVTALAAATAAGQATTSALDLAPTPATHAADDADEQKWAFSLSVNTYLVPDNQHYVQPTFTADHSWLHLEARYNYEDLNTTSVWVGCNFSFGQNITFEFTPMLGGVFGDTEGIAPGYKLTVGWRRFEFYSEGQYLIDTRDESSSFIYTWTELTYSPLDWLRAGVVIQRTQAYETDLDIQHGLLVGLTYKQLGVTAYLMDPENDPFLILGVSIEF